MFTRKNLLILIDLVIVMVGYLLAYITSLSADQLIEYMPVFKQSLFVFVVIYIGISYIIKIYEQVWRYADSEEYRLCIVSAIIAGLVFGIIARLVDYNVPARVQISSSTIVMSLIVASRIVYKNLTHRVRNIKFKYNSIKNLPVGKGSGSKDIKRLAIVGAGDAGVQLLSEIKNNKVLNYRPICFVDDSQQKIGRSIYGVNIYGPIENMKNIIKYHDIELIVIAIPSANAYEKKRIVEICSSFDCEVKILPGISYLINRDNEAYVDESSSSRAERKSIELIGRLRNIDVEDLLLRDTIKVNDVDIEGYIRNKVVMVTGGGGSIGSEICRQVVNYGVKKLVILDNYENNAYDIEQELKRNYNFIPQVEIITVRDCGTMDKCIHDFIQKNGKIDVLFHAAAHKHVPLMENNPDQAIKNNILGTYNIAKICDKYKISKMIFISTDKAVNPTNVMGATKRACEMVIQAMNKKSKNTIYAAVRFGNVLGSNGSVIPLFKKQIENGGPITVTHPDIIRYFMTIPEAVSLVLNAGGMAKGGEIFVLDMGDPVKITDLAKNMIKLAGLKLGTDIEIEYTGLRPGEKLFEELLMEEEGLATTKSEKIFIGRQLKIKEDELFKWIEDIEKNITLYNKDAIVEKLKELVDTFKTPEDIKDIAG